MTKDVKNYQITRCRIFIDHRLPFMSKVGAVGCRLGVHKGMNPDINEKNFPVIVQDWDEVVDVFILRYDCRISDDEVLVDIKEEGLKPFDFPKLLDFAINFKDLSEEVGRWPKTVFIALGATRKNIDNEFITPYFQIDKDGLRKLDVLQELGSCNPNWAFLAFNEQNQKI